MTTRNWMFGCGLAAVFVLPLQAQEVAPKKATELEATVSVDSLIGQLGDDDYHVRKAAEKQLIELGTAARKQLELAAEKHADTEIRWRARRLANRLNGKKRRGLAPAPKDSGGQDRADRSAVPKLHGLESLFDTLRRTRDGNDPMAQLRSQLEGLEARLERMAESMERGGPPPGITRRMDSFPFVSGRGSNSTKVEISQDGVRVEISKPGKGGEPETKVYAAEDMDAFRQKYPEIAERHLRKGGFGQFDVDDLFGSFRMERGQWVFPRSLRPQLGEPLVTAAPVAPPKGRTLGVFIDASAASEGLLVKSVVDDSLAAELGVKAGDIITAIGEVTIKGQPDVARSLGKIAKGHTVELTLSRDGRELVLKGEKLESAKPGQLERRAAPPVEKKREIR